MDLEYRDVVHRSEDIGLSEEKTNEDDLKIRCKMCHIKDDDFRRDLPLTAVRSTDISQEAAQDITERERLQMMIPVRSLIETMSIDYSSPKQTQKTSPLPDSELVPTQPINLRSAVDQANKGDAYPGHGAILSQKRVAEIQKHLGPRDRTLSEGNRDQQSVQCQCGWDGEESAMVSLSCFADAEC
jgi:hypothetical protein